MGRLKEHLFIEYIEHGLGQVRKAFRDRYTEKKEGRFMIKGLTYEIGRCAIEDENIVFDISSKMPQEILEGRAKKERYFREVVKIVKASGLKPHNTLMDNVLRSTEDEKLKERDYIRLIYSFKEKDLCTSGDIDKRFKQIKSRGEALPDVPGVTTIGGKILITLIEEAVAKNAKQAVNSLVTANKQVRDKIADGSIKLPAARKPTSVKKKTVKATRKKARK